MAWRELRYIAPRFAILAKKYGASGVDSPATQRFNANEAEFDAIREFIETACASMKSNERQRVVLLIEELFTNSVNHGYGGDSDQPVWLTLNVEGEDCQVIYEDCGPPHDPFSIPDKGASSGPTEDRPIGGLGILLLIELSSTRKYQRRGDRNVIELQVRRSL